jgi:hypothetical protein
MLHKKIIVTFMNVTHLYLGCPFLLPSRDKAFILIYTQTINYTNESENDIIM